MTERAIRPCLATYSSPLHHCQKDTEGWSGVGCPGCPSGNDSSLVIDKGERVSVRYRAPFGLPIDYVRGSLFLTERVEGGIESLTQCCLSVHGRIGMRAKCFLIDATRRVTYTNKWWPLDQRETQRYPMENGLHPVTDLPSSPTEYGLLCNSYYVRDPPTLPPISFVL